jgi:hypothetical protein
MKKYNYINNLEKSFKKKWEVGMDRDSSLLNKVLNLGYYVFLSKFKKLDSFLFVRLSVRGKIIYSSFYLIAFVAIPLIFIFILFLVIFISFKIFG